MTSDLSSNLQTIKESLLNLIKFNEGKVKDENDVIFDTPVTQSTPDCLKILDKEGRLLFMNYNGLCQMEIDDFSKLKGKEWWTLWGEENETMIKNSITKAVAGECSNFIAFCPTAKGTAKWWDVSVEPIGAPVKHILSISKHIISKGNVS